MEYRELMIGAGKNRRKQLFHPMRPEWSNLTTLDMNPGVEPDIVHDLNNLPIPLANGMPTPDSYYDEVHAYAILEHLGTRQGKYEEFFAICSEIYRILKPNGFFMGITPRWDTEAMWGDPGHVRCINQMTLAFLDQSEYTKQVGITQMTDYRFCYSGDFKMEWSSSTEQFCWVMSAQKPSRIM